MARTDKDEPPLGPRFEAALTLASRLHARQLRKGTSVPYVAHLLSVAALVLEDGGDEDQAIAGLLHDAVEDQGGMETYEEIRRLFGDRVATIVDGCTDAWEIPKPPWRQRKEEHLERLRTASPEVLRVTAADKLHNARTILSDYRRNGEKVWTRFRGGRDGTLWHYRELVGILRGNAGGDLTRELELVVGELETLAGARRS